MTRAIPATVLAIVFMAGVSAQDTPNFAGRWKSLDSFTQWTISVEGSEMTVTRTVAGNSESTVYMLDGTPSPKTVQGPNGPVQNVYTSQWEGDVLVTTITTAGPHPMIEKRWLEADGTMKFSTTIVLQGKSQTSPVQTLKKIG